MGFVFLNLCALTLNNNLYRTEVVLYKYKMDDLEIIINESDEFQGCGYKSKWIVKMMCQKEKNQ